MNHCHYGSKLFSSLAWHRFHAHTANLSGMVFSLVPHFLGLAPTRVFPLQGSLRKNIPANEGSGGIPPIEPLPPEPCPRSSHARTRSTMKLLFPALIFFHAQCLNIVVPTGGPVPSFPVTRQPWPGTSSGQLRRQHAGQGA